MPESLKPEIEKFGQPWPDNAVSQIIFLARTSSSLELALIQKWLDSTQPAPEPKYTLLLLAGARTEIPGYEGLSELLEQDSNAGSLLVPLHVAWRKPRAEKPRFSELVLGDPREPRRWKQASILANQPNLIALVAAQPATVNQLRERHRKIESDTGSDAFAEFVVRQALLSLERAERGISGMRHKMPRFVRETVLAQKSFRQAVKQVPASGEDSASNLLSSADEYLKEMVSVPRAFFVDLSASFFRFMYSRGYEEQIVYKEDELQKVRELIEQHPVVFCFTHKSHVDAGALYCLLHDNGFPMLHTFGGINMAFLGMGSLMRRAGVIFIRRSFQNNPLYKLCLRFYISYLLKKHFPLAWAIEGTRSRTGKLMPPKLGILKYVMEAAEEVDTGQLHIVPVSIIYDLIPDVADYVAEQGGKTKTKESLSWFVSYMLGMNRPHGRIAVEFGDPVMATGNAGSVALDGQEQTLRLQKIAFEVCVNANRVTPITSSSLIAMVLLGAAPQALTYDEIRVELWRLISWARRRHIPMSSDFDEATETRFLSLVESMIDLGIISRFDEGPEVIYMIARDQDLLVSYYRNTAIHFCFQSAIIELALLKVAEEPASPAALDSFWLEAFRLRDLLKFEFFYSPSEQFKSELIRELDLQNNQWKTLLCGGRDGVNKIFSDIKPLFAHATLRSFFEAYSIAGDVLLRSTLSEALDKKTFMAKCIQSGKQAYLQRRITSEESVAGNMFENALTLIQHLNLMQLDPVENSIESKDVEELRIQRLSFSRELKDIIRRIQLVQSIASTRRGSLDWK